MNAVTVHTLGARAHWARTIPAPVDTQLWLAHHLREDLVEVTRRRMAAVAAVWSAHPRIGELEARIAELDGRRAELREAAAKVRSAARSRRAEPAPDARAELKEVNTDLREAKAARRAVIGQVRDASKADLVAAYAAEKAETKALYGTYCQVGVLDRDGETVRLFWAVYNDVVAHHRVASERVAAARAAGRPADLRHHRHDGGGALAVQLQRAATDPPRTPTLLASGGGKWRNVLTVPDGPGHGWVRMRVGEGHVEIPVTAHRDLPEGADVTGGRLVVRRVAGHRRASVHLTARVPATPPRDPTGRPVVALHLGWRHVGARDVQVAVWRATASIRPPNHLLALGAVTVDSDRSGTVTLPAGWRAGLERAHALASERGLAFDAARAALVAHLGGHPPTEGDGWPTAGEASRWRSPARLAALTIRHRDAPPPGRAGILGEMEEWRRVDRHRWEREAHGRDKAIGRRRDHYSKVASWLVTAAGRVVVCDTHLGALAPRSAPGPDAAPTAMEDAAATQRTHAAVGSLRERLAATARREGVEVVTVPHTGMTRTHYRCGYLNAADGDYTRRVVTCAGCGQGYDQDRSAVMVMLAASGAVPPAGAGAARGTG